MADMKKVYEKMAEFLTTVGVRVGAVLARTVNPTPENPVKLYSDMYLISKGHLLLLDEERADKRRMALQAEGRALGWTHISFRTYEHVCPNACGITTITTAGTWYPVKDKPTVCPLCNRMAYIAASESLNPAKSQATLALAGIKAKEVVTVKKAASVSDAVSSIKKMARVGK